MAKRLESSIRLSAAAKSAEADVEPAAAAVPNGKPVPTNGKPTNGKPQAAGQNGKSWTLTPGEHGAVMCSAN